MHAHELLISPRAHMAPAEALDGLSPADAERRMPGAPHSIAEILAHMIFWQEWFEHRCHGHGDAVPERAALGWPDVSPGSWPHLVTRFTDGLTRLAALDDETASRTPLTPAIEFPPFAAYTIRDVLEHASIHNAHHLGQVVLLRQMIGAWPPPAGSYTW